MSTSIRKFKASDVAAFVASTNNGNVVKYLPEGRFPLPYTATDGQAFVSRAMESPELIAFAITVDDVCVGAIGALVNEELSCQHSAEIGYWLAEEHWGRGILSEALGLFLLEIKERFVRIWAEVVEENVASLRVLKKHGFEIEGLLRKSFCRDNEYRNTYILSLVR